MKEDVLNRLAEQRKSDNLVTNLGIVSSVKNWLEMGSCVNAVTLLCSFLTKEIDLRSFSASYRIVLLFVVHEVLMHCHHQGKALRSRAGETVQDVVVMLNQVMPWALGNQDVTDDNVIKYLNKFAKVMIQWPQGAVPQRLTDKWCLLIEEQLGREYKPEEFKNGGGGSDRKRPRSSSPDQSRARKRLSGGHLIESSSPPDLGDRNHRASSRPLTPGAPIKDPRVAARARATEMAPPPVKVEGPAHASEPLQKGHLDRIKYTGCAMIRAVGLAQNVVNKAMLTSFRMFHLLLAIKRDSNVTVPDEDLGFAAIACLLLGTKAEYANGKERHPVEHLIRRASSLGVIPRLSTPDQQRAKEIEHIKRRVFRYESTMMKALAFRTGTVHPTDFLEGIARQMRMPSEVAEGVADLVSQRLYTDSDLCLEADQGAVCLALVVFTCMQEGYNLSLGAVQTVQLKGLRGSVRTVDMQHLTELVGVLAQTDVEVLQQPRLPYLKQHRSPRRDSVDQTAATPARKKSRISTSASSSTPCRESLGSVRTSTGTVHFDATSHMSAAKAYPMPLPPMKAKTFSDPPPPPGYRGVPPVPPATANPPPPPPSAPPAGFVSHSTATNVYTASGDQMPPPPPPGYAHAHVPVYAQTYAYSAAYGPVGYGAVGYGAVGYGPPAAQAGFYPHPPASWAGYPGMAGQHQPAWALSPQKRIYA